MTVLRSGSASDVGRVRAVNEDLALETLTLFAVADGMGGHAGGEVASRTAIEALEQEFARQPTLDGLVTAVRRANQSVWDRSHADPDLRGMGTTLTAAALVATDNGDKLVLANVGDSRSYRFHDGTLTQLSKDHSVAEELVDRGELSEAEAAIHPHRHILTRALGVSPDVEVDVWQVAPEAGDRYLLCSDGLTNEVSTRRITSVLATTQDPQQAAETLVRMANEHGGNDNVTVVVLDVLVGDERADGSGAGANGSAVTAVPTGPAGSPPAAAPASLLTRAGSDALSGARNIRGRAAEVSARLASRRITLRVLLFVVILAALVVAGFVAVRLYVDSSYFVQLTPRGNVEIFQGRIGGFLGMKPHVVQNTGVPANEISAHWITGAPPNLKTGVEEPSLANARKFVRNLFCEWYVGQQIAAQTPPPTTTTTAPAGRATTTTTTAPPPPTTTTTLPPATAKLVPQCGVSATPGATTTTAAH